jgi:hypothetical protein
MVLIDPEGKIIAMGIAIEQLKSKSTAPSPPAERPSARAEVKNVHHEA